MKISSPVNRASATARKHQRRLFEIGSALLYEIVLVISMAVIFPITTRALGPGGYGEYTTIFVIAGLAITWAFASGGAAIVQLVLQADRDLTSLAQTGRRQVVLLVLPFSGLGTAAVVALFGTDVLVPALLIIGVDLLVAGLAEVHLAILFAVRGVTPVVRIRSIGPIVRTLGVVGLALFGDVTLLGLAVVNLPGTLLMLAVATATARPIMEQSQTLRKPLTTGRELARYTSMYGAAISANNVQDSGEKIVLAAYRPAVEVGEYQAAYRLVQLALMPVRALEAVAIRWFLPADPRPDAQVSRALRLSVPVGVYGLACIPVIVLARPALGLVVGEDFELALEILLWLSAFPLVRSLGDIPTMGLLGLGRNAIRMWLGIGTAALSMVFYFSLVPSFGWRGAVVGTYLSEFAMLAASWWMLIRYQRRADQGRQHVGPDTGAA